MLFLIRYLFNLSILNYLFSILAKIDNGRILEYSYNNLADDLNSIYAPFDVSYTYFIYSVPIALALALIYTKFYRLNFNSDSLEVLLKKLILITIGNLSVISFSIYFFRIYELLSRLYVISYIILYPILLILFELILHLKDSKFSRNPLYILRFIIISVFVFINFSFYTGSLDNILNKNRVEEDLSIVSEKVIESLNLNNEFVINNEECSEWKGTGIYSGCIGGIKVTESKYENQITNVVVFDNNIFYIFKEGLIYRQTSKNGSLELFMDISDIVYTEFPGMSQGLYSLAFHPTGESLLVSYSNSDIALVIAKYNINKDGLPDYENSEELLKISNNVKFHFGGSIIWSDFFNGFLVGIGDMRENIMPLVHSDALNTTSYKGKVVLLSSNYIIESPLINEHGLYKSLENIIAYGLRNPWQLSEYENRLFITDVGSQFIEEINVVNYEEYENKENLKSVSFGWPLLMGDKLSYTFRERNKDALTRLDGKITDLYYSNGKILQKADDYLIQNSKAPLLSYDHFVNEDTIRAAIIGGDFIRQGSGNYKDLYFFTDYVENELYGFNVNTENLFIFPLPNIGNATSLKASPFSEDTLIIAYSNGSLLSIELP